jgi:tetratricopeptide (TPR) repeat protein
MDQQRIQANNYGASGQLQKALEMDKQSWDKCKQVLGEKDVLTFKFMGNYAEDLQSVGDYTQALAIHKKLVRLCRETLGRGHETTILNTHNYAHNLALVGNYEQALELSEQTLQECLKSWGSTTVLPWAAWKPTGRIMPVWTGSRRLWPTIAKAWP